MKNKLVLLSLLAFAPMMLTSCNKGGEEQKQEEKIVLSFENDSYVCFEDDILKLNISTNSKKNVEVYSSDPTIASVSSEGLVFAKKRGTVVITATVEGITVTCNLEVKAASEKKEAYIELEENSFTVGLNETTYKQIKPLFINASGTSEDVTFTYSSLNENIVEVDENGVLTPKSMGSCFVSVKANNVETRVFVDSYNMTIRTPDDWLDMLKVTDLRDARFTVLADLDFTGYTYEVGSGYDEEWKMLMFLADIKGNNHTISNITFKDVKEDVSLFGFATHLQVSNLAFRNITVDTSSTVKFGLTRKIMKHYTEPGPGGESVNNIYTTLISNVVVDASLSTNVSFVGFAVDTYGIGAENVYFNIKNIDGEPLKKTKMRILGDNHYLWWEGSFISNIVFHLEGMSEYTYEPSHAEGYALKVTDICVTDKFIEANYFASTHFDMNIWNIVPNDIPTLNK